MESTVETSADLKTQVARLLVEHDRLATAAKRHPDASRDIQLTALRQQIEGLLAQALADPNYAREVFTHQIVISRRWVAAPESVRRALALRRNTTAWIRALYECGGDLLVQALEQIKHWGREHTDQTSAVELDPKMGWRVSYTHTAPETRRIYELALRAFARPLDRATFGFKVVLVEINPPQFRDVYDAKSARRWLVQHPEVK